MSTRDDSLQHVPSWLNLLGEGQYSISIDGSHIFSIVSSPVAHKHRNVKGGNKD